MAMRRDPMYINMGLERKSFWFPLKFQPPFLIHPFLSVNEDPNEYDRAIEEIISQEHRENKGYYWNYDEEGASEITSIDFCIKARVKDCMLARGPKRS